MSTNERYHLVGCVAEPGVRPDAPFAAVAGETGTIFYHAVSETFGTEGFEEETKRWMAEAWALLCRCAERCDTTAFRFGQIVTSPDDVRRVADLTGIEDRLGHPDVAGCAEWSVSIVFDKPQGGQKESYLSRLSASRKSRGDRAAAFETTLRTLARDVRAETGTGTTERTWRALVPRTERAAFLEGLSLAADRAKLKARARGPEPLVTFLPETDDD